MYSAHNSCHTKHWNGRWDQSVYYSVQWITQGGRGDTIKPHSILEKNRGKMETLMREKCPHLINTDSFHDHMLSNSFIASDHRGRWGPMRMPVVLGLSNYQKLAELRFELSLISWEPLERGSESEAVRNEREISNAGKYNWILPKEINANRFFWDSHWLKNWSNHFCPSKGPNGGSVAMDSVEGVPYSETLSLHRPITPQGEG